MLSRVAESIFWTHRYIERIENYARFIGVNFSLALDLPHGMREQWSPLIKATGDWEAFQKKYEKPTKQDFIYFLSFDMENPNSIRACVKNARENARTLRDHIPWEVWEEINNLFQYIENGYLQQIWTLQDPTYFFSKVKFSCHQLYGLEEATLPRTEAWLFSKAGINLERADKTTRILDVKYHILLPSTGEVGSPIDMIHWSALLRSVSGFSTYRKFYGNLVPYNIAKFLTLDQKFPRAVFYCIEEIEELIYEISNRPQGKWSNMAERKISAFRSELEYTPFESYYNQGLHEVLDGFQQRLNEINNAISETFFSIKR